MKKCEINLVLFIWKKFHKNKSYFSKSIVGLVLNIHFLKLFRLIFILVGNFICSFVLQVMVFVKLKYQN